MNSRLKSLLEHLEHTVHPAASDTLYERTLRWEAVERLPISVAYPLPADTHFPPYRHREVFADPEKMLFNELVHAFETSILHHATVQDDLPFTIRANFGTGVIASLFGTRIEQVDDNPPWVRSFEKLDAFQRVFDHDPLDFSRGWCPRVVERYEFYCATLAAYPRLNRAVRLVLPDLQGPMDTAEMLRGSEWYVDLVERPEMADRLLGLLAKAQVGFARRLQPLLNDGPPGFCHQHATALAGNILIRNDSAIMISPAMYREQVAPHDEWVLREMGGGGIHSCGNIGYLALEYLRLPSLRSLDLGQPEQNDLDALHALVRERKVALIRVDVSEDELLSGRVQQRFPAGVTLHHRALSLKAAAQFMTRYRTA